MVLHRYTITGIESENGREFEAVCVAYDIISAIAYFRDRGYAVMTVPTCEQVPADTPVKIEKFRVVLNEK